jgi:hypothetical protein
LLYRLSYTPGTAGHAKRSPADLFLLYRLQHKNARGLPDALIFVGERRLSAVDTAHGPMRMVVTAREIRIAPLEGLERAYLTRQQTAAATRSGSFIQSWAFSPVIIRVLGSPYSSAIRWRMGCPRVNILLLQDLGGFALDKRTTACEV